MVVGGEGAPWIGGQWKKNLLTLLAIVKRATLHWGSVDEWSHCTDNKWKEQSLHWRCISDKNIHRLVSVITYQRGRNCTLLKGTLGTSGGTLGEKPCSRRTLVEKGCSTLCILLLRELQRTVLLTWGHEVSIFRDSKSGHLKRQNQ